MRFSKNPASSVSIPGDKPKFSRATQLHAEALGKYPETLLSSEVSLGATKSALVNLDTGLPFFDEFSLCSFLSTSPEMLTAVIHNIYGNYHTFFLNKTTKKLCSYGDGLNLRRIDAPYKGLKEWQLALLSIFKEFPQHPANYAFVSGKNIVSAAESLKDGEILIHADLKNFFAEHTSRYVFSKLRELFAANGKTISNTLLKVITALCTLNNVLPQGSPCSPMLTIILNYELDERIDALAKSYGLDYRRYADDLLFSGTISDNEAKKFCKELAEVVHPFRLNYKKLGIMRDHAYPILRGCAFTLNAFLPPTQSAKVLAMIKEAIPEAKVTIKEKVITVEFVDVPELDRAALHALLDSIKDKIEQRYKRLSVKYKLQYFYIQSVKTCLGLHISDKQVKFPRKMYTELRLQAMLMGRQRAIFRTKNVLEHDLNSVAQAQDKVDLINVALAEFASIHAPMVNKEVFRNLFLRPFNRRKYRGKLNYLKSVDSDKYDKLIAIEDRADDKCVAELIRYMSNRSVVVNSDVLIRFGRGGVGVA